MNILFTLNDKFVPQVASSICSICENNKETQQINFYLISMGISEVNKKKLHKFVEKYKRHLDIIELENLSKYLDFKFDTNAWNPIVLSRLLIDKLLPNHIDKILYLDGDTIVRGSLESLYKDNMDNKVIGMSIEPTVIKKNKEKLGLSNSHYYNSGVLLINFYKWRKEKIGDKIIAYYKKNDGNLFAPDQDAINGTLKNQIYPILPKYNFCNTFTQYPYKFLKKLELPAKYISKEEFDESVKNPIIVHYLGEERPWRKGNTHKYRKDYKKYLNMTPWKDTEDEKGWEMYFICWSIFNVVTKPFPKIRYNIITSLIPAFMKYRSKQIKKEKES